jgi:P-type conjugative transfer protein TrbG
MKTMIMTAAVLCALAGVASAEEGKPWAAAIRSTGVEGGPPPVIDPLGGREARLTRKERRGLAYGREWARNRDLPARGKDGSVVFVFGATLPSVVCAPLYVCDLVLQEGEAVNDVHVGDAVRWQISPATQGTGEKAVTHIIIKPTDIGLTTNLLITTNRRAYSIKLVSQAHAWMPRVSFQYPDAVKAEWGAYRSLMERREAEHEAAGGNVGARLDFNYAVSGDAPWRPLRVYAAGGKTYIQFPAGVAHGDLPALVALADDGGLFTGPTKELVNYRYVNGRFEVDKVLQRAALISGVGMDQVEVKIMRMGGDR